MTYGDGDEIYTTNNGGAQWDRVSSPIMPIGIGEYMPNDQAFYKVVGNTIYIIVGAQPNSHSRILKSTDKGLTWYAIIPPTNTTSASFDFKDDNNGLYVDYTTQPSKLYSTTDGGQNWSLLNSTENLHYLKYIPNQNMYISTNGANGLLYSTNNGQTWITHPSFENVRTKNSVFSIKGTTYITGDGYVYSSKNIIGVNPSVDQATINSSTTLDLTFSNNVEIMSSNDTANYVLTYRTGNTIQRINTLSALRDNSNYALVHISTQTPLPFDTITIKVNNVYDMVGNPLINGSSSSTLTVILNLALSTSAMDIAAPANSTNTFSITSNLSWEIASDQTWLIPSSTSGSGNSTITLTATANNTGLTRSAIVTISATGVENQTIVVTQLGNDILGNSTVYSSASTAANRRAIPVTFNENGEINSISVYHNGGSGNMLLGVYADVAGKPASRLGMTSSVAVNSVEGWQTVALANPVSVSSGQKVWLSFVFRIVLLFGMKPGLPEGLCLPKPGLQECPIILVLQGFKLQFLCVLQLYSCRNNEKPLGE
ncbi:MAG: hypothetical protein IPF54_16010 [Draconibacterium sp.]|nr:hypothetical protein [Draconibacterium sp.]